MLLILYHLFSRQTCLPPFILSLYVSYFHTHPKTPSPKNFSPAFPCPLIFSFKKSISGDEGYRSPCPSHAKRMLYHLSYIPSLLLFPYFPYFLASLFFFAKMHPVGFEPTHLSIAVLETAPLDHSGTNASLYYYFIPTPVSTTLLVFYEKCIRWGSNPRISR